MKKLLPGTNGIDVQGPTSIKPPWFHNRGGDCPEAEALAILAEAFARARKLWPDMKAVTLLWEAPDARELYEICQARDTASIPAVLEQLRRVLIRWDPLILTSGRNHPTPSPPFVIVRNPLVGVKVVENLSERI